MRLIAITPEEFFENEADAISMVLDSGFWRVHLRKPQASELEMRNLIEKIPQQFYHRLSLHDFHNLQSEYRLGGVHLNSRNHVAPDYDAITSRSCHSIEELKDFATLDYLFLSPIFDSISKNGYKAAFSHDSISDAAGNGLITSRIFALGGITPDRLPMIQSWNFGGAVFLGYLWGDRDLNTIRQNIHKIQCYNS